MLSISNAKQAGGAVSYFSDHLVEEGAANPNEDYYTSGEAGTWLGSGAEALGFEGEVTAEDFGRALLAIDKNDEALVQNANNVERRAGWDLTFSAPKSVSSLWAAGDQQLNNAIAQAHSEAVAKAMSYLQSDDGIISRRGKGGLELENSKLVAAKFDHGTSREQDPQLHSHVFTMNLAQRADGSFGTIQSAEIFKRKMSAGAVYRAELSAQLQQLGFSLERDKKSFKVAGVSEDLQKHWSKRRTQVLSELENSSSNNAKAAERATLKTRSAKEEVDQSELVDRWHEEAAEFGLTQEAIFELQRQQTEKLEMPEFKELWTELTQQVSTLSEHQLKAKVIEAAQGILDSDQALYFVTDLVKSEETIKLRDAAGNKRYTSREMYGLEQSIIDNAKTRQNESHAVALQRIDDALNKVPTISDEQEKMVRHVTSSEGISLVEGMAGTGKSFSLGVARDAWESEGKNVIGAALAGKAAAGIEEGAGIKSQTLHSLLFELSPDDQGNPPKRQLTANDVLVIDEAGMVGSRQMSELLNKAAEARSKVVLVGDSRQLQPIDAGGAFRGLSKELGAAELKDIRRQKSEWHKHAVTAFADGEAGKALAAFKERDLLMTGKTHSETISKMAGQFAADKRANSSADLLMLAATRRDVALLNQAARERLADTLAGDSVVINHSEFLQNDRILFTKNNKNLGVKNGSLGIVIGTDKDEGRIKIKLDSNELISFTEDDYEHVQHGYAVTTHKSQGATVDKAYVLADEQMSASEWSYVAASRSKEDTHIFVDADLVEELDQVMSRTTAKQLSNEFELELN